MALLKTKLHETETQLTRQLLEDLLGPNLPPRIAVRLWDGSFWPKRIENPQATLVLKHPSALREMLLPGTQLALGEAYIFDDFDIEGDIEAVLALGGTLMDARLNWLEKIRFALRLRELPTNGATHRPRIAPLFDKGEAHSLERDKQAVTYHYNLSNDFYSLWLDKRMVYSCAYFKTPQDDLDTAQANKLDYICRKLRLKPGQRLLDIGCGWGGLLIYAAQNYGVEAVGITLSQPQADLANERIRAAGLAERVRARVQDYRQLNEPGEYDALVSVGMFEHVGASRLPEYFAQAYQLLRPGGVFLNHGISIGAKPVDDMAFINTYVFPDGDLVPISTTLRVAEQAGFEARDVESLREHYAMTLRFWVDHLEAQRDEVLKYVDERVYRIWRLYMAGSIGAFKGNVNNLYQALLVKPYFNGASKLPLTRAAWYDQTTSSQN